MTARRSISASGLAIATVAVAIGLRLLLWPIVADRVPFITLFAAVIFVAWYGGRLPGLVAVAASALGAPPRIASVLVIDVCERLTTCAWAGTASAAAAMPGRI